MQGSRGGMRVWGAKSQKKHKPRLPDLEIVTRFLGGGLGDTVSRRGFGGVERKTTKKKGENEGLPCDSRH